MASRSLAGGSRQLIGLPLAQNGAWEGSWGSWGPRTLKLPEQRILSFPKHSLRSCPHPQTSLFLQGKGTAQERPPDFLLSAQRAPGRLPFFPRWLLRRPGPGASGEAGPQANTRGSHFPAPRKLQRPPYFYFIFQLAPPTKPCAELQEERNGLQPK